MNMTFMKWPSAWIAAWNESENTVWSKNCGSPCSQFWNSKSSIAIYALLMYYQKNWSKATYGTLVPVERNLEERRVENHNFDTPGLVSKSWGVLQFNVRPVPIRIYTFSFSRCPPIHKAANGPKYKGAPSTFEMKRQRNIPLTTSLIQWFLNSWYLLAELEPTLLHSAASIFDKKKTIT